MAYFKGSKNTMSVIGHLGADAQTKPAGKSQVTTFKVATNLITGKGEKAKEKTIWIPCELWGENEVAKFLKKGQLVSVEAFYDASSVEGEGDEKKYFHSFKVDSIILLGKKKD
ncbi:MAG TPA: single-stranded DNA-binding protein [Cyclobacteriaceae bacterium]|nr:single-stranded DNA-binding protein [Cyclobacteriaceae bacterium]